MALIAKYSHTNLIARDWRKLAEFYQQVFGCVPVPPERDFHGEALEAGTNLKGAHLQGIHLRLPGYGVDGPTLEIFSYEPEQGSLNPAANRPGYGHVAFQVEEVASACQAVFASGGSPFGEIVTLTIATGAMVTWCYVQDPEGNLIEVQSWS
jgi:catechol 2,3-dioxygenase-like lactoylglutathione lyase family enzyme